MEGASAVPTSQSPIDEPVPHFGDQVRAVAEALTDSSGRPLRSSDPVHRLAVDVVTALLLAGFALPPDRRALYGGGPYVTVQANDVLVTWLTHSRLALHDPEDAHGAIVDHMNDVLGDVLGVLGFAVQRVPEAEAGYLVTGLRSQPPLNADDE
ncbi:hypothetical protein [Cryptosporangium sp. NPDC048952]|uniref:hypothetical protein n=1 Tax=Cryptosporangium sp. NPDC048952 TaxID=3363961 RepID=UPI003715DEBA